MNPIAHTRWYRTVLAALLVALLATPLSVALAGPEQPDALQTITLPPGADVTVEVERPAAAKGAGKLESMLAQIAAAYQASDQATLATFGGQRHVDLAQGAARVILEMDVDPQAHPAGGPTFETVALPNGRLATIEHAPPIAIRAELAAAIAATGASYETAYESWVQVLAPFASLEALSKIDGVRLVRLPFPAQQDALPTQSAAPDQAPQVGTQTTQGVNLTNINTWHSAGWNGTGIKLAVFDFGFTNWTARKTSGDLPSGTVQKDFSATFDFTVNSNQGTAGYDHGTACAEIAYDMAPDATVYLYAFDTDVEFGNAVLDYRNNVSGKRVASMSIGWVNAGPYDGTGPINAIVDGAQSSGIFWANSAGNQQRQHHSWTSAQYSGGGNSVAFGTGNIQGIGPTTGNLWNIPSGTTLEIFLEWNDWNATRTGNQNRIDYDVVLYRYTGSSWASVTSAINNQCFNANALPVEELTYTVPSGGPYNYGIAIWRYQVSGSCTNNFGHWMQLHTHTGFFTSGTGADYAFWYRNTCNSITIPADGNSAVAAGATFWGEDGVSGQLYGLETFSSLGPRNASGGGNPGAAVNKPDVVAPDGVSTVSYGASNSTAYRNSGAGFWGTSASAPHVAGMAAAVWEIDPSAPMSTVRAYIQSQALYKADGGTCGGSRAPESGTQNNRFGWGRINLSAPTAITLAEFSAQQVADYVEVNWETVSELDNRGFNLYRGTDPAGPDRQLNSELIPSQGQGSPSGFVYTWDDHADLTPNTIYFYWLEDVSISGSSTMHGPVSVLYMAPTAVTVAGMQAGPVAPAALPLAGALLAMMAGLAGAAAGRRSRS